MGSENENGTPYENVEYLLENGPATAAELPTRVETRHRAVGVTSFTIRGSSGGDGVSFGKHLERVYYLDDHSPEAVIVAFVEANRHLLDHATAKGLVRRFGGHGPEWRETAREVLRKEFGMSTGKSRPESRAPPKDVKCWRCGERVSDLGTHLSEDCSESDS